MNDFSKKLEGINLMHLACSDDTQQTFGKMFADLRLRPEANFPTLYGRPDGMLGTVVGGLNSIVFKEGEKVQPVIKKSFCSCLDAGVGTVLKYCTVILHPFPHGKGVQPQLFPGTARVPKGILTVEKSSDFLEHVSGKAIGMWT